MLRRSAAFSSMTTPRRPRSEALEPPTAIEPPNAIEPPIEPPVEPTIAPVEALIEPRVEPPTAAASGPNAGVDAMKTELCSPLPSKPARQLARAYLMEGHGRPVEGP